MKKGMTSCLLGICAVLALYCFPVFCTASAAQNLSGFQSTYQLTDSELLTLARMIYEPESAPQSFVTALGKTLYHDPKCGAMNLELLMIELQRPSIAPELRQKIQLLTQGVTDDLDHTYNTTNFTIDYNDTYLPTLDPDCVFQPTVTHPTARNTQNQPVPWYVYLAGEYLEYSRTKYVEYGFEEPGSVGLSNVDIHNLVDAYGQTAPLSPIELDNDMCGDLPADWIYPYLAATAAHELFHQVEYQYVLLPDPDASAAWIKEGSAAWAEDAVYDGTNEYVNKMAQGDPQAHPSIIQEDPNQDLTSVSYQAVSFWKNLTEWLGHNTTEPQVGIDLMLALWQEWDSILSNGTDAVNTVLQQTTWGSHTYDEAFHRWAITNRVKDFGNQPSYDYREDENCPHYLWGYTMTDYPHMSPPTAQLSVGSSLPYFGTVNAWANRYYEFNVDPAVGEINVNCDMTSGSPYWQVVTVNNSNVATTYQSSANNYDLNLPGVAFNKLIVIVSGNADAAGYAINVSGLAGGTPVSGAVSGVWTVEDSPYYVTGDIYVPGNESLTIQPGVQVIFQGHFRFTVGANALLTAVGTEQDSIFFTSSNTSTGWYGIRFSQANIQSQLKYCDIRYGKANGGNEDSKGGGIYCWQCSPNIQFCTIAFCVAYSRGAGLYLYGYYGAVMSNVLWSNSITAEGELYGGGIYCEYSDCYISSNAIVWNFLNDLSIYYTHWARGAGICALNCSPSIVNNLINDNYLLGNDTYIGKMGAGVYLNNGGALTNNTICNNWGASSGNGGGICAQTNVCNIKNCIIWYNSPSQINGNAAVTYSNVQGGFSGTGNISGDPVFVNEFHLSQIAAGQAVNSPCVNAGDPTSSMITGTTRTDGIQDEGIVDMGCHYPNVVLPIMISMEPVGSPITVPAAGGSFGFVIGLQNTTTSPQPTQFWCNITLPGGQQFTSIPTQNITLPAGANVTRNRTQNVPGNAPSGMYTYWGYIGSYPWTVTASDYFLFSKAGAGSDWFGPEGWSNTGEGFEEFASIIASTGDMTEHVPPTISPNPFNPSTVASYKLQVASHVSLKIYDTAGRLVATLVNGWRDAGEHQVTFDGSRLASGVYIARLQAGENVSTQKMVLLK
jgi:hypothetical protein